MTAPTLDWQDDAGHSFRAERLPAKSQFHLSRKVAPLLPKLAPLLLKVSELGLTLSEEEDTRSPAERMAAIVQFLELSGPLAEALADIKTADADYVFDTTLASVKVETSPGAWMPLWNPGAAHATVIELDSGPALLPIVVKILVFNLKDFIGGFLTSREEPSRGSIGGISPMGKTG